MYISADTRITNFYSWINGDQIWKQYQQPYPKDISRNSKNLFGNISLRNIHRNPSEIEILK